MSTVQEFITELRGKLQPRGSQPLVRLSLRNHGFVGLALVTAAIDELERKMLLDPMTGEVTALEKLAILLLRESAP
jgi:hypothetical protein